MIYIIIFGSLSKLIKANYMKILKKSPQQFIQDLVNYIVTEAKGMWEESQLLSALNFYLSEGNDLKTVSVSTVKI